MYFTRSIAIVDALFQKVKNDAIDAQTQIVTKLFSHTKPHQFMKKKIFIYLCVFFIFFIEDLRLPPYGFRLSHC